MNETGNWVLVCNANEIDDEEVLRFDYDGRTFAIYNMAGNYHATDGFCTHEQQHLSDGIVLDGIIECPLHMGQFDIETGEALSGPVCFNLKTYDVRNDEGEIYIRV